MAVNRPLTSEEKEILVANQDYKNQVSWALRDFASTWGNPDEAQANTQVGQVGYLRWAKNYSWGARALANVTVTDDPQAPEDFGVLLKGMDLWDSAVTPFNVATVITYMVDNGKFTELAILYVNSKTPTMVF